MAHFAQLNENNEVVNVVVVKNEIILDVNNIEQENIGIQFLKELFGNNTNWVQTSYNGNFRGIMAGVGHIYDPVLDIFKLPDPVIKEDGGITE